MRSTLASLREKAMPLISHSSATASNSASRSYTTSSDAVTFFTFASEKRPVASLMARPLLGLTAWYTM